MRIETAKGIVNGTGALAGSSSVITIAMAYLKTSAIEIGVLCSIISLLVYILFQFLYYRKLILADENKAHIEKVEDEVRELSIGIKSILDKINKDK